MTVIFTPGQASSMKFTSDAINLNPNIVIPEDENFEASEELVLTTTVRNCSVNE